MSGPISKVGLRGFRAIGVTGGRRVGSRSRMFDRRLRVSITIITCGKSFSGLTLNIGTGFTRLILSSGINVIRPIGLVGIMSVIGLFCSSVNAAASSSTDRFARVLTSSSPPAESRAFAFGASATLAQAFESQTHSAQVNANRKSLTAWGEALPRSSTVSAPEDWTLFGGRLTRMSIDVPGSVSVVAKALTQARPWVSHLNVVAGEVLLSGQRDGVNWLASLVSGGPHPRGIASTRGYLSVWVPHGLPQHHRIAPLFDALRMPPAAQLIFDIDDTDSALAAGLQVWRAPAVWKDPCVDLTASLRQTGWQSETASAPAMLSWRRDRELATVHCRRDGRDTLIFMHRSKERT